jgi:hypothetical protein
MLAGDGNAAALAFRWLAAVAAGFELAIVTEHFDESLLLLGKEMGWPVQDLIYLSQARRRHHGNRFRLHLLHTAVRISSQSCHSSQPLILAGTPRLPLDCLTSSNDPQKRRKSGRASSAHPYDRAPAARAVANSSMLGLVHAWPEAQTLRDLDAPWLWPHELDAVIRGARLSEVLGCAESRQLVMSRNCYGCE